MVICVTFQSAGILKSKYFTMSYGSENYNKFSILSIYLSYVKAS